MADFCLDPVNGDDTKDGSQWTIVGGAGPWKTIKSGATAARIAPGDLIKIAKSPDPVSLGVNGTFTHGNGTVALASALTQNIDLCELAWTSDGGANVVCGTTTTYKIQGTYGCTVQVKAAFGTGLAAHKDVSTLDLSPYEKVSFWIMASAVVAAGYLRLDLCTNADGTGVVHSITFPAFVANKPFLFTWDNGSALNSAIKSVALYVVTDLGASDVTVYLDNIFAANDLHLRCVIGKNDADGDWFPIQSVNGTSVILGFISNIATNYPRYIGTTATVAAYVRELLPFDANNSDGQMQDSGSKAGGYISYVGGYNPSTDLVDGQTWLISNPCNPGFEMFTWNGKVYCHLENLYGIHSVFFASRAQTLGPNRIKNCGGGSSSGWYAPGAYYNQGLIFEGLIRGMCSLGSSISALSLGANDIGAQGTSDFRLLSDGNGLCLTLSACGSFRFTGKFTLWMAGAGSIATFNGNKGYIGELDVKSAGAGISLIDSAEIEIGKLTLRGTNGNIALSGACGLRIGNLQDDTSCLLVTFGGATSGSYYSIAAFDRYMADSRYKSYLNKGVISDHITGGQAADWAYGGAGLSLLFNPSDQNYPLPYVFYIPVTKDIASKISIQVRKTSSGADCTLFLTVVGCGITDIIDEAVTLTDSWAEFQSSEFTPTFDGFVRCELKAYDGATTGDIGVDELHLQAA